MAEGELAPALDALDPDAQVLVSLAPRTDLLSRLPETAGDVVVLAVRSDPVEIEAGLRAAGVDPARATVVPIGLGGSDYDGPLTVTDGVSPTNLGKVGLRFSRALEATGEAPWVVVDDLSVLLMYCERERVERFLGAVVKRVRVRPARGLYGLVRDAVGEESYARLRARCDAELDLRGGP